MSEIDQSFRGMEIIRERDDWKQRALDAETLVEAKDKNLAMKEEWLQEWKRVAEELKAQIPAANRLCKDLEQWKQRAEVAEKACAEMREAFKSFECTICDENHKFRHECNACLSGEPSACTCDREELVPCPCCMEGEYAEGYRKLRAAIKDGAGTGYVPRSELEAANKQAERCGRRCRHCSITTMKRQWCRSKCSTR